MSVEEIILEKVVDKNFPLAFNFPAGHVKNNLALKLGIHYNLYVTNAGVSLSELQAPHPDIPTQIVNDSVWVDK